jgi:hypothetical protein
VGGRGAAAGAEGQRRGANGQWGLGNGKGKGAGAAACRNKCAVDVVGPAAGRRWFVAFLRGLTVAWPATAITPQGHVPLPESHPRKDSRSISVPDSPLDFPRPVPISGGGFAKF